MNYISAPGLSVTLAERQLAVRLARETAASLGDDCLMINIGVGPGATCWCLREGAPVARIVGIDIDPDSGRGPWEFHRADSRRFHEKISGAIGLLLVDGDHDYNGVRADILNWSPKVSLGGVVIFHDYGNGETAPHTAGVKMAVDELMGDGWEYIGDADSMRAFRRCAS